MTHTIASLADRVITNSRYVADAYCAEDSRLTDRVRIIYNAIDLGRFSLGEAAVRLRIRSELNVPYDTPVVIMIGNVQTVKGHFLLAEAACSVVKRYPETRFVIVAGSVGPNYASSLRGRIKSMLKLPYDNLSVMKSVVASAGQGSSFVFIGNRSDIPELLAASDILVFIPQKAEGFGRPLIEAMAAGIPVVATDIGPTREILGEGTGVLVETGSSEVVARALVTLLSDQELCGKMGRSGRERATQLFSIHDYCAKVTKVYEEVSSS
jgi:glycosyltransferase involved in cell wall biosynthesis